MSWGWRGFRLGLDAGQSFSGVSSAVGLMLNRLFLKYSSKHSETYALGISQHVAGIVNALNEQTVRRGAAFGSGLQKSNVQ